MSTLSLGLSSTGSTSVRLYGIPQDFESNLYTKSESGPFVTLDFKIDEARTIEFFLDPKDAPTFADLLEKAARRLREHPQ